MGSLHPTSFGENLPKISFDRRVGLNIYFATHIPFSSFLAHVYVTGKQVLSTTRIIGPQYAQRDPFHL